LATIRDVARSAGVSIATVSRVFNGSSRVSEQTASRVWSAASDLDYWPNSAARSLTTHTSNAFGVLLPDLYGEFFSEVIRGIDHAARRHDYQILISSSHANADEIVGAAKFMRGRIDGLIIMASDTGSAEGIQQIAERFPVVLLNPCRQVEGCSSISLANFAGARTIVEHLLDLGHRDIAIVQGPPGNVDAEERLRGYREALQGAGLAPSPALEWPGDFTELSGLRAADMLLQSTPRPTAVFAANDCMAVGFLSALHRSGLDVPESLAVVGFDDTTIARYLSPPLTTVHVDTYELGSRAVQLLLSSLDGSEPKGCAREMLPATLMVRSSCGSPRQREQPILQHGGTGS
jgi:LacI family transcriptional regulator